jgi:hypothetical protein
MEVEDLEYDQEHPTWHILSIIRRTKRLNHLFKIENKVITRHWYQVSTEEEGSSRERPQKPEATPE